MNKKLEIVVKDFCHQCPYFREGSDHTAFCGVRHDQIPDNEDGEFPIPRWCPLPRWNPLEEVE